MQKTDFTVFWKETDSRQREALQDQMQLIINTIPKFEFDTFDAEYTEAAMDNAIRPDNPVFCFYDQVLERLLTDIPQTQVKPGTVAIWYLYNMGFVIKTPTTCFGIDIHHRFAIKLEPLLDFMLVTHNHNDHYNIPLFRKMTANNKLIVSNFFPNRGFTKAVSHTHEINDITIHCGESDHNERIRKFTMPMEIICPTGDKKFVFFTSGDTSNHNFLQKHSDAIDLYAVHPRNAMSAIEAARRLNAKTTLIVHLQELGHEVGQARWEFQVGRDELAIFRENGFGAYVPFWGEKLLWDGEKLNVCQ